MHAMKVLTVFALSLAFAAPTQADTMRLEVGKPLARFAKLRPGVHRYIRYTVGVDGSRKAIDIWQRTVSFGPDTEGRPDALHITQRWDRADGSRILIQDSWFDARTFTPRTHVRHTVKDGKDDYAGYRFDTAQVVGMTCSYSNAAALSAAIPQFHCRNNAAAGAASGDRVAGSSFTNARAGSDCTSCWSATLSSTRCLDWLLSTSAMRS